MAALLAAQPSSSVASLAASISDPAQLGDDDAHDIVRVLATLYVLRDRAHVSATEFLDDLETAAKETGHEELTQAVDWPAVRSRLDELLAARPLALAAKSFDVLNEHERIFCDARILTDIRPVFATDVGHAPDAMVLIHELRISYHVGGRTEAIYIAMDSGDLHEVGAVVTRAFKKEEGIQELAAKSGVPVLKPKSHQE